MIWNCFFVHYVFLIVSVMTTCKYAKINEKKQNNFDLEHTGVASLK